MMNFRSALCRAFSSHFASVPLLSMLAFVSSSCSGEDAVIGNGGEADSEVSGGTGAISASGGSGTGAATGGGDRPQANGSAGGSGANGDPKGDACTTADDCVACTYPAPVAANDEGLDEYCCPECYTQPTSVATCQAHKEAWDETKQLRCGRILCGDVSCAAPRLVGCTDAGVCDWQP